MGQIRVATFNVRGLKMAERRTAVFLSVRNLKYDVLFLQECHLENERDVESFSTEWTLGPSFWGVGNVKADGVGIIFFSWELMVEASGVIVPGRVIFVDARWRGVALRFINVYGPSKREEREGFLENFFPLLYTNRLVVLGGDFNMSLEKSSGGELAGVIKSFGLQDSGQAIGGEGLGYTWWNSRQEATRLDYVFFSKSVKVRSYTRQLMWCSDHCLVGAGAEVEAGHRGRGKWRMNVTYLQDPTFCKVFRALYAGWCNLKGFYPSHSDWWEGIKERIRFFCRAWGVTLGKVKWSQVRKWTKELQVLCSQNLLSTVRGWKKAKVLQDALNEHYRGEARTFCIQSGVRQRMLDERPTKFFFSTVKGRQKRSSMECLDTEEGKVYSVEGMLKTAVAFYKELFANRVRRESTAEGFLEDLDRTLEEVEAGGLEKEVTLKEVEVAIKSLKKGTSPGGDGLPAEFYQAFLPLVGPELVAVYQESLEGGKLPLSMRIGLVTLLHKKNSKEDLANWRPITLLNTDYKILAKVLTLRLKEVVSSVVHPDQTCGVPGRSGSLNLVLIRDVISWAEQRQLPLAILSLDQEKAYDRVSHSFLWSVLEKLGFGPKFRAWIQLLYNEVFSQIRVNGFYSEPVEQLGGVRQGCPLSPLCYILFLEPLISRLRLTATLTGVILPGGGGIRAKVSAYADDMTIFLTTEKDFVVTGEILQRFSEATGAKVNVSKSSVMLVGRWSKRSEVPGGYTVCQDGIKILGVRFFRVNSAQQNWEGLLESLQSKIGRWSVRDLSLWGRVQVVKADVLPSINHLAYVFPLPFWQGRRMEKLVFSFIWRGGTELVSRAQMFRHLGEGGRGVPCLPWKVTALFIAFATRLVVQTLEHKAHVLARFWLGWPLRLLIVWSNRVPWSLDRPEHYKVAADTIKGNPWCLEQSLLLNHRELYVRLMERSVTEARGSGSPMEVNWLSLQPDYLVGRCKDVNWLAALGRLPVRERLYRHGQGRSPLCPLGCGGEETIEHALWSCPGAVSLWKLVAGWWREWGGPLITWDLVLYGARLGNIKNERRRVVWVVVSEGKRTLWEWRVRCLRKQLPGVEPQKLFLTLLANLGKEVKGYKAVYGEERTRGVWGGLPRVGVG